MTVNTAPAAAAPDAAAIPVPQPTATPPVVPTAPPAEPTDTKKLVGDMMRLLTTKTDDSPEPPKKDDNPVAKEEPAAPAPTKKEAPKAEDRPIRVRKAKESAETPPPVPKKGDLQKPPVAAPAPAAPAAAAKPVEDDAAFEKDLVDEERAQLEDARNAEKYLGDKYKGHGAKMTAFLRENAKKAQDVDDGEMTDSEYQKWYGENLPKISPLDYRQIAEVRAEERVMAKVEPKIQAEAHARWVEAEKPKIKVERDSTYRKLLNEAAPDDFVQAFTERTKGITDPAKYEEAKNAVLQDFAIEVETTKAITGAASDMVETLRMLTTNNPATNKPIMESRPDAFIFDAGQNKWIPNLTGFDAQGRPLDPVAAQQAIVFKVVEDTCNNFKANGGAALKNDKGQWFVTREEWYGMDPAQRKPFWTFDNDQIITRALQSVKSAIKITVDAKVKDLETRYGMKRVRATPAAAPQAAPSPAAVGAPPAPRPAPVPAGGGGPAPTLAQMLAGNLTSKPVGT